MIIGINTLIAKEEAYDRYKAFVARATKNKNHNMLGLKTLGHSMYSIAMMSSLDIQRLYDRECYRTF